MFRGLLAAEFAPYCKLSPDQLDRLERHYHLLTLWNKKINLTRIQSMKQVVQFHYCESLFLGRALPAGRLRIVDIGSGGGFPGLPVAVLRSDCTVDLVEAHRRKSVFLLEASRHLTNVRVVSERAEALKPDYDWVIARAVRPADVISLELAPNVALLLGENDAARISATSVKIPWGSHRVLVAFHVERDKI